MKKKLCVLLIIAMIISIAPFAVFAMEEQSKNMGNTSTPLANEAFSLVTSVWDESLFIHMDDEGYVTFEPNFVDHELILDGDFIHIRLPMEIDVQAITLSLPEGWTYKIDYEEEVFPEHSFNPTTEREEKTYTIVTVQHTWNHFSEEPREMDIMPLFEKLRQMDVMPLSSYIPDGFTEFSLSTNASLQDWSNALGPVNSKRLIWISSNHTNMPGTINISDNREVIIASNGTNLANNTLNGSPFILTRPSPGTGRHFNVIHDSTLTLVQIILDGENHRDERERGGVFLAGWPWPGKPRFNMLTSSEIRNCRADLGGGIQAEYFTTVLIDGGILRNNIALNNGWGGGGGARIRWGSFLTLQNALIIDNKATSQGGHGGGIEITHGSELTIKEGTIIRDNFAGMRGGGVAVWFDSIAVMEDGQIVDNKANQAGGGVVLTGVNEVEATADITEFTMNGGIIEENWAGERGGGISGIHPMDIDRSTQMGIQKITINDGEIRKNTSANGGGVWFHSGTFKTNGTKIHENIGVNGAGVYWAEGPGVWETEGNETNIHENKASGNGGGLATVGPHNRTIPARVNIQKNEGQNGGGVWMGGSGILTMTNMTNPIQGNRATGNGGGVYISTGTFAQSGSSITENDAAGDGGGVYVVHGSRFNGTGGSIIDNIAHDGGGLYVPHPNLSNVTIASNFVFDENFARNGLRIDTELAERWHTTINPGTVTLSGEFIIDGIPEGSGNFRDVDPHAFTNYDINSNKPMFWRVTYNAVGGEGEAFAFTESNRHPIKHGALLPGSTALIFEAVPIEQFERWTVETREAETSADGKEVDFTLTGESSVTPLRHILTKHTHVVGYFQAQTNTTTLTVSKEVTGDLANRMFEFDFTVILQDSTGNPQSTDEPLPYTITDSNGIVLTTGVLTLDNEGRAMFSLSHGQRIQITEVPLESSVQIVETLDDHYQAWFTDSESVESKEKGGDTGLRPMTEDRSFHFENVRFEVPATGIVLGNVVGVLLLFTLLSIPAFATLLLPIGRGRYRKLHW